MTENEAIEKLEAHIECESKRSSIEGCKEGCIDCELAYLQGTSKEHIESVKIAIQALEKQIPKKPYHISQVDDNDNANVECPACHATTDYAVNVIKRGHCWKCGQLLDWSDDNEID